MENDKIKYDPNTGKELSTGQSVSFGGKNYTEGASFNKTINNQIPLDTLKSNETPIVPPPTTTTTTIPEVILPKSELDTEVARLKQEKQTQESGISNIVKQLGLEQGKEAGYVTEEGGDTALKEYKRFESELEAEKLALRRQTENVRKTFGGTTAGLQDELGRIERDSLSKQADIAILGNAAKGQYDAAVDIAKRKVESAIAPLKADLDAKKFIYENNKDLFSKAESSKLDILLAQEENKIAREEKKLDTIEQIKIEAAKNGMKSFTGFDKVKTVDEALQLAGSYLSTPQTEIVKLDSGSTVVVDKRTGKIINTLGGAKSTGGSGKLTPEFSSIVSRTAAMEGTVAGKEAIANDLNRYLSKQDYSSAYNQIENTVANGLTGTSKTTFQDARIDSEILKNLRGKIQEFENAGGDTGLLKGNAEQITRKLGQVKDPALASLAVELQREFQRYRVGMTGAAFSPKESRDYASVNPKTTNKFDLNLAVIDGAISQLDNRVNSTVDSTIKGAGDIRKLADVPKNTQEAKKQVENFYTKTDDVTARLIDSLYNSGKYDDISILEYLKAKGKMN